MRLDQFEVFACGSGTKNKPSFAKNTDFRYNRPHFGPQRPSVWERINLKIHQTSQADFIPSCHIFISQLDFSFVHSLVH